MSLQHLAQNMAAQGRNGDTMLMHVTPDEVQKLQGAAMAKGGSLTINPQTGLPEANFLSDLNPVHIMKGEGSIGESGLGSLVIGAALASMGIPPMYAGLMTGGATAVLTGDLQKGLFAGMGAYGGAGMMGGLESLGGAVEGEVADQAINSGIDAQLSGVQQVGGPGLENGVQGFTSPEIPGADPMQLGGPDMAQTVVAQPSPIAADKIVMPQTTTTAPGIDGIGQRLSNAGTGVDRLTSKGGLDALSANMGGEGLNNPTLKQAAIAAGAGFLGGMSPKTDGLDVKNNAPGYIRPYTYDPFGQKYTAYTPVKADEWGSRTLATGGIVALANGGAPGEFRTLAEQRLDAFKQYEAAQQPQATPAPQTATAPQAVPADPYNTMTGGSKAAYEYLMGQRPSSPVPYTPTGEIYKPYSEAVMGMKADPTQFATTFNPETRQYDTNPNYKPFTYDAKTGQETRGASATEINNLISDPNNLAVTKPDVAPTGWLGGAVDKVLDDAETRPYWMVANDLTYEDLSRATGSSVSDVMKRFPKTATPTPAPSYFGDSGAGANGGLMPNDLSYASGGIMSLAGGGLGTLGGYSDGGRLLKGPGDGVSDSIPASIGDKQPARLADGEFVVPARIVSELGNGSTDAGARKLYQMMDRVQKARGKTTGKGKVAANSRSEKYLPA